MDPAEKQAKAACGENNSVAEMSTTTVLKTTRSKESLEKNKNNRKMIIDCTDPMNKSVMNFNFFIKFLQKNLKCDGESNNFNVSLKKKNTKIIIKSNVPFMMRYLKYVIKSYLKETTLHKLLKIVKTGPNNYTFKILDWLYDKDVESRINEDYSSVMSYMNNSFELI
ncbi:60S ribosomal protein L22-like [Melanaphis sacchari]|uniref:Large ribosomal subunit protein eL22 n=1 Tax=Melanaphis sacchari TaxID=742174 RepID=A0A2H8TGC4_9HEMI|nr:60S ribosomal protein L22-like [Melanaphis sacchari]XP_025206916.1 60S ribosomal protein L22-like [Melanaphis sacchari]XP_025206917.1 60S ribosomal protein L22-like [Melanaphis sacchari]